MRVTGGFSVERKACPKCKYISYFTAQCFEYKNLTESNRLYTYGGGGKNFCDKSGHANESPEWTRQGSGWFRFTAGPKGRLALRSEVHKRDLCRTDWSGYLDGDASSLPDMPGQTRDGIVKFKGGGSAVDKNIRITMCSSFLVFELPDVDICSIRYCAA